MPFLEKILCVHKYIDFAGFNKSRKLKKRVPCFIYFAETPRYRKRNKETKKNEPLSLKLYGICFRILSFWQRAFLISNSSTEVPKLLTSHFNICLTFKPAQNLGLCDKNCNNIDEIHN